MLHRFPKILAAIFSILLLSPLMIRGMCLTTSAEEGIMPISGTQFPSLSANSAILIEAESGCVIFEKNAHTRMPMASTTKMMTALVAIEQVPLDRVVTVSPKAVGIEGSSVYLYAGEQLTMEALLYAMLLESANDAAAAIAIEVAGSIDAFADLMNQKAEELGLCDTHFENPHGLGADGHYTTAYDLAIIAATALKNQTFRTIVSTYKKTIPMSSTNGVRLLINHNKMLKYYDGAIGVKTGFTKQSGRCLVSAAERNGTTLVSVTLNAPDDWNDHTKLLDHGFSLYEHVTLLDAEAYQTQIDVIGGTRTSVTVTNPAALEASLPVERGQIHSRTELPRFLYGQVEQGAEIGRIVYFCDRNGDGTEEVIGECALIAVEDSENVKYPSFFERIFSAITGFFSNIFG